MSQDFYIDSVAKQVQDNLASNQIADVLDILIFKSLEPIFFNSYYVERTISTIIKDIHLDHRRKLSSHPREELISRFYSICVLPHKSVTWKILKTSRVERNIWFTLIENFLHETEDYLYYEKYYLKSDDIIMYNKMQEIEKQVDIKKKHLSAIIKEVKVNYNLAIKFKNSIVNKYIRYAKNESIRSANSTGLNIDAQHLFGNLSIAISKAIDKYDQNKGALTSYIQKWFMDAKTNPEFSHEYSTSYEMSAKARRKLADNYNDKSASDMNFSVSIDNIVNHGDNSYNAEQVAVEQDKVEEIHNIVRKTKKNRLAMLMLDIPYKLSEQEKQNLKEQS